MSTDKILDTVLRDRRASRREFMTHAAAAGLSVGMATSLWATRAGAADPKHGGQLIQAVAGGATTDTLDGATLIDTHAINTSWQVRNCMSEVTAEGDVVPELVESWEPSDDASQWVFKVRQGVEFHNGKTLDAEDIAFSINHHRGPDANTGAAGAVAGIETIKVDDKNTLVFNLIGGNADFPFLMSDYHLTVVPNGTDAAGFESGIGTGPFVLTEWDPGVRSAGKRNPNYFKEGRPYFDDVITLNVADAGARQNAILSGEVDAIEKPDSKTMGRLANAPGIRVIEVGGNKHYVFPMATNQAPYDINDLRLALKYGVDRDAMLRSVLSGHGYLGNDHPIGKGQRYFDKDLPQRHYDADKAKFHLKKAGYDSITLKLTAANIFPGGVDAAVLYKEHAAPIGIDIEVERVPTDGYWANVWMQKPWIVGWWSGRATEDWMFSTAYAAGADWNESYWVNDRFNVLLNAARAELNQQKRAQMYAEMQQICSDEGGTVIPLFANVTCAVTDAIGTPEKVASNWDMDGDKNTERWWRR